MSHYRRDIAVNELLELVQNVNCVSLREQVNWVMSSVRNKVELLAKR